MAHALAPQPIQRPAQAWAPYIAAKSLLFCTVGAAIVSCIPHLRSTGVLASRSIALISATISYGNILYNGTLGDCVSSIGKLAATSFGFAAIITSTPMLMVASLATDAALQAFETVRGINQRNEKKIGLHVLAIITDILTLSATLAATSSVAVIVLMLMATLINIIAMIVMAVITGINEDVAGSIGYAFVAVCNVPALILSLSGIFGEISKITYKLQVDDKWFEKNDEAQWKFAQENYIGKNTWDIRTLQSGVIHKGELVEVETPGDIDHRIKFEIVAGQATLEKPWPDYQCELINVPTFQEMVLERIPAPIFIGPALVFEQDATIVNQQGAPLFDTTIDIHERDSENQEAVRLLTNLIPLTPDQIAQNVSEFKAYLGTLPDSRIKQKALYALEAAGARDEFGPLLPTHEALIARLWYFSSHYAPVQPPGVTIERERDMAKYGIVLGLSRSFNFDGTRVCDQGKKAHLVVSVLQGRLNGVNFDYVPIPRNGVPALEPMITETQRRQAIEQLAHASLREFFNEEANRELNKQDLIRAAEAFIANKPGIDRGTFLQLMNDYMVQSEIIQDTSPAANIFEARFNAAKEIRTLIMIRKSRTSSQDPRQTES